MEKGKVIEYTKIISLCLTKYEEDEVIEFKEEPFIKKKKECSLSIEELE